MRTLGRDRAACAAAGRKDARAATAPPVVAGRRSCMPDPASCCGGLNPSQKPSCRTARDKLGRAAPCCHATDQSLDVPGQDAAAKGRLCKSRDGHGHEDAGRKGRARHCRLRRKPTVALVRRRQASRTRLARPRGGHTAGTLRAPNSSCYPAGGTGRVHGAANPRGLPSAAPRRPAPPLPAAARGACGLRGRWGGGGEGECLRLHAAAGGAEPCRIELCPCTGKRRSFSGASGAGPAGRSGGRQGGRMRFAGANCAPAGRAQGENRIRAGTGIRPASALPLLAPTPQKPPPAGRACILPRPP